MMATTFARIDDLLGGRKSDVLNQPAGGMAGQPQASPESPGFKAPVGNQASSGFAGGAAAPVKSSEIATGQANNAYLNDANKNAVKSNIIDKNVNTIKSATDAQKASAQKYVTDTSQAADAYIIDDKTIDSGISGNQEDFSKIGSTLGADLKIGDWQANDNSGVDVSSFADPAKINVMETQAANQSSGGQYTLGMSKLDAALRGAANLDYNKVFDANNQFVAAGAEGKAAADAAKTGEVKQIDEIKAMVKKTLGERQAGIQKTIADRKAAEENRRLGQGQSQYAASRKAAADGVELARQQMQKMNQDAYQKYMNKQITRQEYDRVSNEYQKAFAEAQNAFDANYDDAVMDNNMNIIRQAGKYAQFNPSMVSGLNVSDSDVTNADEALRFNNINKLFGTGKNIQAGTNNNKVQFKAPVTFTPELTNKIQNVLKLQPNLIPVVEQIIQEMGEGKNRAEGLDRVTSSGADRLDTEGYSRDIDISSGQEM